MAKKKAAQKAQKPGPQKEAKIRRKRPERPMSWFIVLLMITIFQVWSAVQTIFEEDGSLNAELVSIFGIYIAIEWLYVVLFRTIFKKKSFELELIAFFLSGIGLVIWRERLSEFATKAIHFCVAGACIVYRDGLVFGRHQPGGCLTCADGLCGVAAAGSQSGARQSDKRRA